MLTLVASKSLFADTVEIINSINALTSIFTRIGVAVVDVDIADIVVVAFALQLVDV